MAGQAQRGSRGRGRSSRPDSSLPPDAAATAPGRGRAATTAIATRRPAGPGTADPGDPRGLSTPAHEGPEPTEAANLTAFICGLLDERPRWSLKQVNQLLFLRGMRQAGRFGDTDGARNGRTDLRLTG